MAGLSYHRIESDQLAGAVRDKKPFKPDTSFKGDPVPALTPASIPGDYKYRPGHGAPDPVPAMPAKAAVVDPFRPLYVEADGSYAGPDPVPAASYYSEEG